MKFRFALLALLLFPIYQTSAQTSGQTVLLEKRSLASTAPFVGITNLFFSKQPKKELQYDSEWKAAETSPLLENAAFVPVYVVRYKTATGEMKYVVDTNGDQDFRNDAVLQFQQFDTMRIANFELTVGSTNSNNAAPVKFNYQLLLSSDGYVYGRVSEYRQGEIHLGDKTYAIRLRSRTRNYPLFSLTGDTVCIIDLNRDGEFSERWHISAGGDILPREDIELSSPFTVDGKALRIGELDPAGSSLKIQPSFEKVSISAGFKAPDFTLKTIDNRVYRLADLEGKIVFLEFWSVSCSFCKRILPEVNALIKKESGTDFVALAVAREEDVEAVRKHLQQEPRDATVVVNDPATWKTYNSQGVTPAYYLIDKRGVIRLSGFGASPEQLMVIGKLVEQIRNRK